MMLNLTSEINNRSKCLTFADTVRRILVSIRLKNMRNDHNVLSLRAVFVPTGLQHRTLVSNGFHHTLHWYDLRWYLIPLQPDSIFTSCSVLFLCCFLLLTGCCKEVNKDITSYSECETQPLLWKLMLPGNQILRASLHRIMWSLFTASLFVLNVSLQARSKKEFSKIPWNFQECHPALLLTERRGEDVNV